MMGDTSSPPMPQAAAPPPLPPPPARPAAPERTAREMGAAEVEQFLTHLAVKRHVSASTPSQALNALVFLYQHVLEIELGRLDAVRARRPQRLPVHAPAPGRKPASRCVSRDLIRAPARTVRRRGAGWVGSAGQGARLPDPRTREVCEAATSGQSTTPALRIPTYLAVQMLSIVSGRGSEKQAFARQG
jgi:Phage integrase, N-terminal SAM-like domain